MKKLLAIFAAVGMITTSGISVVACGTTADVGGYFSINPSSKEELLDVLEENSNIEAQAKIYLNQLKASSADKPYSTLSADGISALSDDDKKILLESEDFQKYYVYSNAQIALLFKEFQFLLSIEENEIESFLEENKAILSKFHYGTLDETKSMLMIFEDLEDAKLAELEDLSEEIFVSETIENINSIYQFVSTNNFSKN